MVQDVIYTILLCLLPLKCLAIEIDTINITSHILNEKRDILIFESSFISDEDSLTIIYMPDGEFAQYRIQKFFENSPKQAFIGVGIINTNRNRDLLPVHQADKFLDFIISELMPEIEKKYKVKTRILFGHSFAGGFTIYSLLNKPGVFDKYIASSPIPIMNYIDPDLYKEIDAGCQRNIQFYFSYGSKDMKQVRKWCGKLKASLSGPKLEHINCFSEEFEGQNHNTVASLSFVNGMKYSN